MLQITPSIALFDQEIELTAIRAQGSGGQNVNKVSSAIHLRFDINKSSLPLVYRERLLALKDSRINKDGTIIIKAQQHRTQEKNKADALERLQKLIQTVTVIKKIRRETKPTKGSQMRRVDSKIQKGKTKALRGKPSF